MNDADALLYTAEKTKTDLAGKISKESEEKINAASTELRKASGERRTSPTSRPSRTPSGRCCRTSARRSTSRSSRHSPPRRPQRRPRREAAGGCDHRMAARRKRRGARRPGTADDRRRLQGRR